MASRLARAGAACGIVAGKLARVGARGSRLRRRVRSCRKRQQTDRGQHRAASSDHRYRGFAHDASFRTGPRERRASLRCRERPRNNRTTPPRPGHECTPVVASMPPANQRAAAGCDLRPCGCRNRPLPRPAPAIGRGSRTAAIALIHRKIFASAADNDGDNCGFLLLSARGRFILRADAAFLDSLLGPSRGPEPETIPRDAAPRWRRGHGDSACWRVVSPAPPAGLGIAPA